MMVEKTLKEIRTMLGVFKSPVLLCSFGKDSMAMLYLVRQVNKNIPIIFFKEPFMQKKYAFAYKVIQDLDLTVYDFPPTWRDFQFREQNGSGFINPYTTEAQKMEVYYGYDTCGGNLILPKGIRPTTNPTLCIFRDFLNGQTCKTLYKWDITFIGHKNSDTDDMLDDISLSNRMRYVGETALYYPLYEWTDDDVWEYIKMNNIPYNVERYDNKNISYDNDYYECCYNCLDPDQPVRVDCFLDGQIENIGRKTDYILKWNNFINYLQESGAIKKQVIAGGA